jgi:hypothetical protein
MSLKREPYSVFYTLNSSTSPNFVLKYKHLLVNNQSVDIITINIGSKILTVLEPNSVKELYDLFESKDILAGLVGVKCTIISSGVNSIVEIDNFGT